MKKIAVGLTILLCLIGAWKYYWDYDVEARIQRPALTDSPHQPWGAVMTQGPLPLEDWRSTRNQELLDSIPKGSKNILVISGGGARGAFGAGILNGWTESGNRPDFDVVTGVSVGSLQSVYAFLGSEYDQKLKTIFAHHQHLSRLSFWDRPDGALLNVEPFRQTIEQNYDQELLDAVAARHLAGARLYVGSTNLDAGEFVIWDMGAIAASGKPDALEHFRTILLASCSMPMVFPPVLFDLTVDDTDCRVMHVDGGVKSPLFLPSFVAESTGGRGDVYVIVNHSLFSPRQYRMVERDLPSIGLATFKTLLEDKLLFSIEQTRLTVADHGMNFQITGIPASWNEMAMALRPEDSVADPEDLFERARALMLEHSWSELSELHPKTKAQQRAR